ASVYRSVRQLVGAMRRFRSGEVSARAEENLPGEFGDLACSFNNMLGEIQGFNAQAHRQGSTPAHDYPDPGGEWNRQGDGGSNYQFSEGFLKNLNPGVS